MRSGSTPGRLEEIERFDAVPGLQGQDQRVVVRRLLGILPADHAVRKDRRPHPSQVGASNLLIGPKPSQGLEVAVRAEDAGARFIGVRGPVQVSGAIKARQCFQGDVLDRISVMCARCAGLCFAAPVSAAAKVRPLSKTLRGARLRRLFHAAALRCSACIRATSESTCCRSAYAGVSTGVAMSIPVRTATTRDQRETMGANRHRCEGVGVPKEFMAI